MLVVTAKQNRYFVARTLHEKGNLRLLLPNGLQGTRTSLFTKRMLSLRMQRHFPHQGPLSEHNILTTHCQVSFLEHNTQERRECSSENLVLLCDRHKSNAFPHCPLFINICLVLPDTPRISIRSDIPLKESEIVVETLLKFLSGLLCIFTSFRRATNK